LEFERLFLLHEIMTRTIGGLYLAPIDKDSSHRILDIGTGTGICKLESAPLPKHSLPVVPNRQKRGFHLDS